MWVLVHEDKAWQITSEDPTGLWGEDYVWVDIGSNPEGVQETWIAKNTKGKWKFTPYQAPAQSQIDANKVEHERLVNKASVAMTPLLVSLQLGDASESETILAQAWQQYYRDLKAINISSSPVVWPTPPEST
jgi:hypothetical protein